VTRILVLGGTGMLGHKLCQVLGPECRTYATFRAPPPEIPGVFNHVEAIVGIDAIDFATVEAAVRRVRPELVVNAIGIVKQREEAKLPIPSILLNSLFPHRVAAVCAAVSASLIHVSTDCVFSGRRGAYREDDIPDPIDLYGRTKLLGELDEPDTLTVRTSMIGRELVGRQGLLEWFLGRSGGRVSGFTGAVFSGLTTAALANIILRVCQSGPRHGMYHVSADAITKHDLLIMLNEAFQTHTTIDRDDRFECDRSLVSERFWTETGLSRPTWSDMIDGLARDPTPYPKKGESPVN
jgi:dTDP-4-dehydrorhamnose reductase